MAPVPYAAMLALAQADPAAPTAVAPSGFRLKAGAAPARVTPEPCPVGRGGEIVVCGRRGQGQRLEPLPPPPGVKPAQGLGTDFAGGRLGPSVSEVGMPNGRVSKRITLDFKLPF